MATNEKVEDKDEEKQAPKQGIGKCREDHLGSFGFPTRPEKPYEFCPQCGNRMVWRCPQCGDGVPDDPKELGTAKFCRGCGAPYFDEADSR